MNEKINVQPLTGMMELTPSQQLKFNQWREIINQTYARFGFTPIATPIIERAEILATKAGPATAKQIYYFTRGDTAQGLRFDLTVPLARYVAAHQNDLTFPFYCQHIGRSYRGERAQRGRFREFYQADADIIGRASLSLAADAQIIALVAAVVGELNLGRFQIRINHRHLISGFLRSLRVQDEKEIIQLLDDAEKIGPKKLREELSLLRLDTFEIRHIMNFAAIRGNFTDFSQALLRLDIDQEIFQTGLDELAVVNQYLTAMGVDPDCYCFDTSIIRGLDYYTGTIFETSLLDTPQLGSIMSGGRYDNLVGNFAKTKMPGVGCSLGLTRVFSAALELGLIDDRLSTAAQVVVLALTDQQEAVFAIAQALRQASINTVVYLESSSPKKALKYADSLGTNWAVLVGDDELASGRLTLKNMTTGHQEPLNLRQLIDTVLG